MNESTAASTHVPLLSRRTKPSVPGSLQHHPINKNPREITSKLADIKRQSLVSSGFPSNGTMGGMALGSDARHQSCDLTKKIEDMKQYVQRLNVKKNINENHVLLSSQINSQGIYGTNNDRSLLPQLRQSLLRVSGNASRNTQCISQYSNAQNKNIMIPTSFAQQTLSSSSKTGWLTAQAGPNDIGQKISALKDFVGGTDSGDNNFIQASEVRSDININVPLFPLRSALDIHPVEENMDLLVPPGLQYAKDYAALARQHKKMEQYRSNNPLQQIPCIICKSLASKQTMATDKSRKNSSRWTSTHAAREKRPSSTTSSAKSNRNRPLLTKVFFPCEHLCVCDTCYRHKFQWSECPLCHQEIKVIFDHDNGREQDDYWDWVNEIKPPLPVGFEKALARDSHFAIADAMNRSIEDFELTGESKIPGSSHDEKDVLEGEYDDTVPTSQACIIS